MCYRAVSLLYCVINDDWAQGILSQLEKGKSVNAIYEMLFTGSSHLPTVLWLPFAAKGLR